MHRATYVSRVPDNVTSPQEQHATDTAASLTARQLGPDPSVNFQIIETLAPYVPGAMIKAQLTAPVRTGLLKDYPTLIQNERLFLKVMGKLARKLLSPCNDGFSIVVEKTNIVPPG